MNLQHVAVAHLMVCTDHASRPSIHTSNKSGLKVGVNEPCKRFGVEADWNHQGVGEHSPITVDPVSFVLHRIHNLSLIHI